MKHPCPTCGDVVMAHPANDCANCVLARQIVRRLRDKQELYDLMVTTGQYDRVPAIEERIRLIRGEAR